jgi:hypothetical protein
VLAVQSFYDVSVWVDLVNNLVSVFLQGSCENNDLVILRHHLDELNTARSDQEVTVLSVLYIMNESLI